MEEYYGRQVVGIDLHRRRRVIVRMTPDGQRIGSTARIDNDPFDLAQQVAWWGESPEVVLEPRMAGNGPQTCSPPPARRCISRIRWE